MTYRMKRNGAGLASICILSTMVLVMISATSALYFGSEDSLEKRYPREINTEFRMERIEQLETENIEAIRSSIIEKAKEAGAEQQNLSDYRSITVAGALQEDQIQIDMSKVDINLNDVYADVYQIYLVPLEDYNASMGEQETLEEGEALLYAYRADYAKDTIGFVDGQSFKIKKRIENFMGSGAAAMNIVPTIALVVPDLNTAVQGIDQVTFGKGDLAIQMLWEYDFDTGLEKEAQTRLAKDLSLQYSVVEMDYKWASIEGREEKRADYFSLFGGLFYLGIMLSIVFIFATVLIIYYKQISEGYEDQARFEIMQKVGMTGREIRKSINSQLLTVFFLPLLGAGLHLSFAFPMIKKLLLLFNLQNTTLFIATTIISFCVFALFYVIVYRISSNAYYQIVSGAKEKE